jgi:prevent-host-death family protein
MKTAGIAELKNSLSRYVDYVRDGGEVVVYDRQTPVARLVPFAPRQTAPRRRGGEPQGDEYWTDERIDDLVRRGVISRGDPAAVADWVSEQKPVKLPPGSPSVVDVLLKMRDEAPW